MEQRTSDNSRRDFRPTPKYDVALSFAGEERQYVAEVARNLSERGVRVFDDEYEESMGQEPIHPPARRIPKSGALHDNVYLLQLRGQTLGQSRKRKRPSTCL